MVRPRSRTRTARRSTFEFSGEIYESGPAYAFSWTGTVSGGTGEFKGAAGNVDMYRDLQYNYKPVRCPGVHAHADARMSDRGSTTLPERR